MKPERERELKGEERETEREIERDRNPLEREIQREQEKEKGTGSPVWAP